jgi:erythritol transport system substrate-binding protein
MFKKSIGLRGAAVLSAAVALTASQGLVAVAQDDEMADGGLVCVIVPGLSNPFFASILNIASDTVEDLGHTALRLVHDDKADVQFQHVETCVQLGANAIILDNAGADATVSAVQLAKDSGIESFLLDREISESGVAASQLTSNNNQGAVALAEYFAFDLMGEEGNYIELTGRDTDTNAHVRSDGYHQVLDAIEGMTMVGQQTANWSQTEGFDVTQQLLQSNADVKGIIAGNDTMALGAQAAVEESGRDIVVVGFDGSDEAIQSIHQGALKATSLQPLATMAVSSAEMADAWIREGTLPEVEKNAIDMVLLTPNEACDYFQYAPVDPATNTNCPAE